MILSTAFPISHLHSTRPSAAHSLCLSFKSQVYWRLVGEKTKHKATRRSLTATQFEPEADNILENVATAQFIPPLTDAVFIEGLRVLPHRLHSITYPLSAKMTITSGHMMAYWRTKMKRRAPPIPPISVVGVPNAFAGNICVTSRLGEIPSQP